MKQKEAQGRFTLADAGMIAVANKLMQRRKDLATTYVRAGRQDLADKQIAIIRMMEAYLSPQLCVEEVAAEVRAIVAELGAKGPGDVDKVMGVVKTRLAGKAEMEQVSAAVKAALAG
jgi:uncharacterized protein YqeY